MRNYLFYLYLIYFAGIAFLFPFVRYYADNPDTFQYLAVTKKYIAGDWYNAINGWWSPMISWLLIFPLSIIKDEIISFKVIQIIVGVFVLFQWHFLVKRISWKDKRYTLLYFFPVIFVWDYSLLNLTPDLLFVGLMLAFINIILKGNLFATKTRALQTAGIGAAMYFTKSFGFPLFITVIILILITIPNKGLSKRTYIGNVVLCFTFFLLLSGWWISFLSMKYEKLTISEATAFNQSVDVAPLPGRSNELPILKSGLLEPVGSNVSAWETPGVYVSKDVVSPFSNPQKYFQVLKRNISAIYYTDFRNQAGWIFIALLVLFIIRKGIGALYRNKFLFIPLLFLLLLYGGYSLILVHNRYIWISMWLLVFISTVIIQEVFTQGSLKRAGLILFYIMLVLAIKRPYKEIFFTADHDFPVQWLGHSIKNPLTTLRVTYSPDEKLQKDIYAVKLEKLIKGRIASLKNKSYERDTYTGSLRFATLNDCVYYGQLETVNPEQQSLLEKTGIDYLITWNYDIWGNDPPLYFNPESGTSIYKIK